MRPRLDRVLLPSVFSRTNEAIYQCCDVDPAQLVDTLAIRPSVGRKENYKAPVVQRGQPVSSLYFAAPSNQVAMSIPWRHPKAICSTARALDHSALELWLAAWTLGCCGQLDPGPVAHSDFTESLRASAFRCVVRTFPHSPTLWNVPSCIQHTYVRRLRRSKGYLL